jgi:hypothetical protein
LKKTDLKSRDFLHGTRLFKLIADPFNQRFYEGAIIHAVIFPVGFPTPIRCTDDMGGGEGQQFGH